MTGEGETVAGLELVLGVDVPENIEDMRCGEGGGKTPCPTF